MEIIKQKKKVLTDVYTVGEVDFLTLPEAQAYLEKKKEFDNIHLVEIEYNPVNTGGSRAAKIGYNKRFFLVIKKDANSKELRQEVLFTALSQLTEVYKTLFKVQTFTQGFGKEMKEIKASGFRINELNTEIIGDIDEFIQSAKYVAGKQKSVKAYKADKYGVISNLKIKGNE